MKPTPFLLLLLLTGLAGYAVPGFSTLYGFAFFAYAAYQTARNSNRGGWAHLGAAYIVSMDVWLRMTKAALPWEFGKIAAIFLLLLGFGLEGKLLRKPVFYWVILLLLPGVFMVEGVDFNQFRQFLTFQLGGMFLLAVSAMYFYRRPFRAAQFRHLLLALTGPVILTVVQVTLRSPGIRELSFDLGANFAASGGYGPNQISTLIGIGMICLAVNWLFRLPPLFSRQIDIALFAVFSLRILLTFSRGGVAAAVLALGAAYFVYMRDKGYSIRKLAQPLSIAAVGAAVFFAVNGITRGVLLDRFRGETYTTKAGLEELTFAKSTSGRFEIVMTDLQMWLDHPLGGVGVGMSNVLRPDYGVRNVSHTEQSRLLSEHGALGLTVLLIILGVAWSDYRKRRGLQRAILVLFFLWSFLSMFHSATRIAVIGFLYGVGFIVLYENRALHRQPPVAGRGLSLRGGGPGAPAAAGDQAAPGLPAQE